MERRLHWITHIVNILIFVENGTSATLKTDADSTQQVVC